VAPQDYAYSTFFTDEFFTSHKYELYKGLAFDGSNNMTSYFNCQYGFRGSDEGW